MPILVDLMFPKRPMDVAKPLNLVTAGIPEIDGCKIFSRAKIFVVSQGVQASLEHTFRNRRGDPVDLSPLLASTGDSLSQ